MPRIPRDYLAADVSNLVWREFHGRALTDANAACCFAVASVVTYARNFKSAGIVWCFDRPPYNRRAVYPGYKVKKQPENADRSEQKVKVHEALERLRSEGLYAAGFAQLLHDPGFEADDCMAAVANGLTPGDRVVLVTEDRDVYQLLSKSCAVFPPVSGEMAAEQPLWTATKFRGRFGIHPRQWPEVKALAGCVSDCVPGVTGVGELTAAEWVAAGGLDAPDKGKRYAALKAFRETQRYAENLSLVTLPFPGLGAYTPEPESAYSDPNWDKLCEVMGCPGLASKLDPSSAARKARGALP